MRSFGGEENHHIYRGVKMRVILLIGILFALNFTVNAQNTVVISDSTEIKKSADPNSETLLILEKGTLLQTKGPRINNWVLVEQGYVNINNVLFLKSQITSDIKVVEDQSLDSYSKKLLSKNPGDLTTEELYYLMYQEQKKNEKLRRDVGTIKNVYVITGVVTTISIAVGLAKLLTY